MDPEQRSRVGFPALVALLLAALWALAGYQAWAERQQVLAAKDVELARLVVAVQEQTLRLLKLTEAAVITATRWVQEHPNAYPGQDPAFIELVADLRRLSDDAIDLRLVDAQGGVHVVPSLSRQPVADVSDHEYFRVQLDPATRGLFLSDPAMSPVNQRWVVAMSAPVLSSLCPFSVVAAVIQIDHIVAPLEAQRQKPNGSITLLKTHGVTLLRTPHPLEYVGKSIAQAPDFIEHLSARERGAYRVKGAFDGAERMISFGRLQAYPVVVAVTASLDDVLAPWWLQTGRMAALMLWVTAAAGLLAARFVRAGRLALDQLRKSERRYRILIENAPDAIVVLDVDRQRVVDANPQAERLFHCSRERLLSGSVVRFYAPIQPDGLPALESALKAQDSALGGRPTLLERRISQPSGADLICEVRGQDMSEDGRRLLRISYLDVTERKRDEARLKLAASVFSHAHEGIVITDAAGVIVDVNHTFTQMSGYGPQELIGRTPSMLRSGRHDRAFYTRLWDALLAHGHWAGEVWNRRKSGEVYAELLTISAVKDEEGCTQHYVALCSDITPMKAHLDEVEQQAHFDALTRLPNRVLLADRLQQALAQSQRRNQALVLAYLDLDGFKAVNDQYGHQVGDELLIVLSQRLKAVLREGDTLARLGGDEFVALLGDLTNVNDADPVLDRLLETAAAPVGVGTLQLQVSASMGVSVYPAHGNGAEELLRRADQAMYRAKQTGKNRRCLYEPVADADLNLPSNVG